MHRALDKTALSDKGKAGRLLLADHDHAIDCKLSTGPVVAAQCLADRWVNLAAAVAV